MAAEFIKDITAMSNGEIKVAPIFLGIEHLLPYLVGATVLGVVLAYFVIGKEHSANGWTGRKGLVAPFIVIGVVLGSIDGGIPGITEAAVIGTLASLSSPLPAV